MNMCTNIYTVHIDTYCIHVHVTYVKCVYMDKDIIYVVYILHICTVYVYTYYLCGRYHKANIWRNRPDMNKFDTLRDSVTNVSLPRGDLTVCV